MFLLIILAVISAVLGVMFLTNENLIKKLEVSMNQVIAKVDIQPEKSNNRAVGLWLVIFGIFLLTIYWRYKA